MARAAFEGLDPRISVSDYEIRRGGASYTYLTLTHFSENTDSELYFLCGTDMFCSLENWRCPEILFEKAVIACALRENEPQTAESVHSCAEHYRRTFGARTVMIPGTPVEISSTEIRRLVREGRDIGHLVPGAVAQIVARYGLYEK
jgi:nicotinate-nucleotide adenylyltransferase